MAASTFDTSFVTFTETDTAKPGLLATFAQRFVEQRTAKAKQMTASYIKSYSDERLTELGWNAADIKRLRNAA